MILREKMNKIKEQKSKQQDSINQNKISISEIGTLSFEDCLKKVEALSEELESGGLVLNDALHKYKLAMAIMDRASTLLMAAKDEIQVIDNNGEEESVINDVHNEFRQNTKRRQQEAELIKNKQLEHTKKKIKQRKNRNIKMREEEDESNFEFI